MKLGNMKMRASTVAWEVFKLTRCIRLGIEITYKFRIYMYIHNTNKDSDHLEPSDRSMMIILVCLYVYTYYMVLWFQHKSLTIGTCNQQTPFFQGFDVRKSRVSILGAGCLKTCLVCKRDTPQRSELSDGTLSYFVSISINLNSSSRSSSQSQVFFVCLGFHFGNGSLKWFDLKWP
jgi:hypothetical protein